MSQGGLFVTKSKQQRAHGHNIASAHETTFHNFMLKRRKPPQSTTEIVQHSPIHTTNNSLCLELIGSCISRAAIVSPISSTIAKPTASP
ncbi:hypothetical protein SLE2022_271760 [Rubroshorea leprosula]